MDGNARTQAGDDSGTMTRVRGGSAAGAPPRSPRFRGAPLPGRGGGFRQRSADPDEAPCTASRARRFRFRTRGIVANRRVVPASTREATPGTGRGRRRRQTRNPAVASVRRAVPILAAAALLVVGMPDRAAQAQSEPTIAGHSRPTLRAPTVERMVITPVPPEASAAPIPFPYRKENFLALPSGAVHGRGDTLTFTLTFDTEVTVTGAPELVLDVFGRERRARYNAGSRTRELTFAWTVAKGDNDPDGLDFRSVDLNGGTIRDADGRYFVPQTVPAHHFSRHRVRGGLFTMRLEVSGPAREGEPLEIRVVRDGGFDEEAVARVVESDSGRLNRPLLPFPFNAPRGREFGFRAGAADTPFVREVTRIFTPRGDGTVDGQRRLTVRLAATDSSISGNETDGSFTAWYLTEGPLEVTMPVIDTGLTPDPVGLRVDEAGVAEAPGAKLVFRVTGPPYIDAPVTVDYETRDRENVPGDTGERNATAGSDYVATRGRLTFQPGEIEKLVEVEVLADDHDENVESMLFVLSNPQGALIVKRTGIGYIWNSGPIPEVWIARFGRTVADQVLSAVESRMRAVHRPGVEATLAGHRFGGPAPRNRNAGAARGAPQAEVPSEGLAHGRGPEWRDGPGLRPRTEREPSVRNLLAGSSFSLTTETGPRETVSLWGRGAVTRFDGRDGAQGRRLSLDGEVASAMVGADWSRHPGSDSAAGAWTAGLIVSHSAGEGGYTGSGEGRVSATLTGLYPWGRLALSERVDAWGTAGYGTGELEVSPAKPGTHDDAATIRTDLDLRMAAVGLRGALLDGRPDGVVLTGKTDALIVRTASGRGRGSDGGGLAAARGTVTRLRLGLEGARPMRLGRESTLVPSLEMGVRHDGGDAETGFGLDLGGGLAWTVPGRGLRMELRGRGLLSHEADGFRERGLSGSLAWDPTPSSRRGPSMTLTHAIGGPASGGAAGLLARGTLTGLAASPVSGTGAEAGTGDGPQGHRLEVKLGYGFAAAGGRFASVPEVGFGLSDTIRDYSVGWRLFDAGSGAGSDSLELSVAARRIVSVGGDASPDHEIGLRLRARF